MRNILSENNAKIIASNFFLQKTISWGGQSARQEFRLLAPWWMWVYIIDNKKAQ